ncbi:redoxin domain-containing protein [Cohnella lupini]|uniref:Peroxiredoxin n=1 Tax=Cohnella lupini TaxID=1294267 RepID=A0A3D9HQF1_9BACL|nr:redoxin domain-containing protein [Cohnella lupini]RED51712.1 peroxiredoxin [Cohnella lupini]
MTHLLQQGDKAPLFHSTDQSGLPVILENYLGRKVLLAFFRNSACALCNTRVHHFIQQYSKWRQQGLEIIAVFESPEANLRDNVGRQTAEFPLIADPEALLYDKYGVETSEEKVQATLSDVNTKNFISEAEALGFKLIKEEGANFHRIPAEFLIDREGIVQVAHYGRLITDHLPIETINGFTES